MEMVGIDKSIFERIEDVKKILHPKIKNKSNAEIKVMLCHCVNKNIGRNYSLTKEEQELLDFILKNNLNPKTIYSYFLVFDYPAHIRSKLRDKEIGFNKAQRLAYAHRTMANRKGTQEIMEQMRNIIRRLEWRNQDEIKTI